VETVLPYLTGPAGALAVLIWVVWMQRKDISDLRRAAEAERSRADSAEEAARTVRELLTAILGQAKR
jgi:hypothetical protein